MIFRTFILTFATLLSIHGITYLLVGTIITLTEDLSRIPVGTELDLLSWFAPFVGLMFVDTEPASRFTLLRSLNSYQRSRITIQRYIDEKRLSHDTGFHTC